MSFYNTNRKEFDAVLGQDQKNTTDEFAEWLATTDTSAAKFPTQSQSDISNNEQPCDTSGTNQLTIFGSYGDSEFAENDLSESLEEKYPDFAKFCKALGVTSSDQLTNTDYIAFRTSNGLSREETAKIRKFAESPNCIFTVAKSSLLTIEENNTDSSANAVSKADRIVLVDKLEESDISAAISECEVKPYADENAPEITIEKTANKPLPVFSDLNNNLPLAEIFGCDAKEFQDVNISVLDLSKRTHNCLVRYGYRTLSAMLVLTKNEIHSIGNMGTTSVNNILTKMQNYVSTHIGSLNIEKAAGIKKMSANLKNAVLSMIKGKMYNIELLDDNEKETFNKFLGYTDEMGKEIFELAMYSPNYMYEICSALSRFASDTLKIMTYKDQINEKIFLLPKNVRSSKAMPFITAFKSSVSNYLSKLCDDDLTIGKISELYNTSDSSVDIADLTKMINKFVDWLNFDLDELVESISTKIESHLSKHGTNESNTLDVLAERNKGTTLEEIAAQRGVTRERIRQIENKCITTSLKVLKAQKYDVVMLYFAFYPKEQMIKYGSSSGTLGDFFDKFWGVFKKIPETSYYFYDKNNDAIVRKSFVRNLCGRVTAASSITEALNGLPSVIHESKFLQYVDELAKNLKCRSEAVLSYASGVFDKDGEFYHREKITLAFMCDYILKTRFLAGFKTGDNYESDRFRQYIRELFGTQKYEITNRALDAKIGGIGCLCDRGKYLHPDLLNVEPEIMEQVYNFIDESPHKVLPYIEIYEALESTLSGSAITNRYVLQGAIKKYGSKYKSNRDYIYKDDSASYVGEVEVFVEERGVVHKSEIVAEFPAIDDIRLGQIVSRCENIFNIDEGYYIHVSQFDIQPADYSDIKPYIDRKCAEVPVNIRALWDEMYNLFPDFFLRNDLDDRHKLYAALNYMFRDDFNFSRPYIAKLSVTEVTNKSVILQHISEYDRIDLEELIDICTDNNINYVSSKVLCQMLAPEFIRINAQTIMRKELTGITDEAVGKVVEIVKSMLETRDYIVASLVTDFLWYPDVDLEWNSFLLESIISISGDVDTVYLNCDPMKCPNSVYVNEIYKGDTCISFLKKILTDELHKGSFTSKEDMRVWLVDNGMIERKLPQFAAGTKYFYVDSKGVHCREDDDNV